ncbi:phosphatidate phosphatase LPIN2-like isoform X1 [Anguilla rostrata]|uniref:phosphatidate phosphatase LPIN2-like isoform X1 n=1 Tax=Anguilla rostrata TaxID=7938 RepID=UPI0030D39ED6
MEKAAGFKPAASGPAMRRLADLRSVRSVPEMQRSAGLRKVSSVPEVGARATGLRSAPAGRPGNLNEEDSSGPDDSSSVKSSWSLVDTMTYVGQLAGQVLGTVRDLYKGINQATLSGCIDVVVVRQPDGTFHCSPFHVRFGKLGVLRSREKVVDIEVNGTPVHLHMKLGDNGEAFFVQETEQENIVPAYLATSPIPSEDQLSWIQDWKDAVPGPECIQNQNQVGEGTEEDSPSSVEEVMTVRKRRLRRRRKTRVGGDGDQTPPTDAEEEDDEDVSNVEGEEMFEMDLSSEEECVEHSSRKASVPAVPDTERRRSLLFPDWAPSDSPTHSPVSVKDDVELGEEPADSALWAESYLQWTWDELPECTAAAVKDQPEPSEETHFHVILSSDAMVTCSEGEEEESAPPCAIVKPKARVPLAPQAPPDPRVAPPAPPMPVMGPALDETEPLPRTLSSCRESSDRDQHQSLLTWLDAAHWNISPQSVSSADSGAECDLPNVTLSLCGGLDQDTHISKESFMKHMITYQEFSENPALIDDPNLVVRIADRYYSWALAAPQILSLGVFQQTLPEKTEEAWVKEKMSKKSNGWWFWRKTADDATEKPAAKPKMPEPQTGDSPAPSLQSPALQITIGGESSSDGESEMGRAAIRSEHVQTEPAGHTHSYKKTLRLSSDQIASLNLREGPNSVIYSITSQYQGTCRCEGTIHLWNWDDKVIISDIDGTITRSDVFGQILPQLGKDWTHKGIAQLYHSIDQNRYRFLYCSARAIGMANMTRRYLQWVRDGEAILPQGPLILSPSSLFSAFHREVIEKKPEIFKIECLTDIRNLFHPNARPFYAAFGNRPNDAFAYRQVGVPVCRIFTVNPKGELTQEQSRGNKSSYSRLSELVEHVFPLANKEQTSALTFPEFSSFCFWRQPIPEPCHEDLL